MDAKGDPRVGKYAWAFCALAPLGGFGCLVPAVGNSCEVDTDEISLEATVADQGGPIRATANFQQGPRTGIATILELCERDILTVNDESTTLKRGFNEFEYS